MNILIFTPDTDIDRRIILQANVLLEKGHNITIVGSPYNGENVFSGAVNSKIKIKRINPEDIKYDEKMVKWYFSSHEKVDKKAIMRNSILTKYYNKRMKCIDPQSKFEKFTRLQNKITSFNIRAFNYSTTKYFAFKHKLVNIIYRFFLLYVRLFKINFFPNFDDAFYNVGIDEIADIVVANDLPSLYAASRIAKLKRIPLIYDAHENYTEQCTLSSSCVKRLEKIEAEILPNVDFWIVPNELLGKCIIEKYDRKYNVKIKECLVIQNSINKWNEFDKLKRKNLIREKLNLDEKHKILLFQGGFLKNRNLENLVRSMKYVKNEFVVMVMLGYGSHVEVLKGIAKKWGIENKVFFIEAVPQSELLNYTSSADVGVIPYPAVDNNTYYCSPNKLYEYIQARLPILSNDLPFLRKMVVENKIGKVEDFSKPQSIAMAVDKMFEDYSNLLVYRENLDEIAEIHSWEKESEKLLEKYNEIFDIIECERIKISLEEVAAVGLH